MSQIFPIFWQLFNVESPLLGLTFGEIWLGVFVIGVASHILRSSFSLLNNAKLPFKSSHSKYPRKAKNDD